jgi:hypothetical protein
MVPLLWWEGKGEGAKVACFFVAAVAGGAVLMRVLPLAATPR